MKENIIYFGSNNNNTVKNDKDNKIISGLRLFLKDIAVCIILIFLTFVFAKFFATATVDGMSMFPTYDNQDLLLIRKTTNVRRGNIVVIWSDDLDEYLCKRVIGLPGDKIRISDGRLYLNDEVYLESYVKEKMTGEYNIDIAVEPNKVFVMGDNRNVSLDSRELGAIEKEKIVGVSIINLTKRLHINKKYVVKIIGVLWITFIIYTVLNDVIPYVYKRKDRNK